MKNAASKGAYGIYFYNHGYASSETPNTLAEAIIVAKKAGFQATITYNGEAVASWCPIGGTRHLR